MGLDRQGSKRLEEVAHADAVDAVVARAGVGIRREVKYHTRRFGNIPQSSARYEIDRYVTYPQFIEVGPTPAFQLVVGLIVCEAQDSGGTIGLRQHRNQAPSHVSGCSSN